jgi:hypothetical protein
LSLQGRERLVIIEQTAVSRRTAASSERALAGKRQGDFHNQSAIFSVGGRHAAAMEADGPFGNGQTDAGAAALPVTGLGHPEKVVKEMVQAPLGHPGAVVTDRDNGESYSPFMCR